MREFVADIGSEAERLQRTTEKLLDLSRRDDGVQPDVTIVDLQQAVHGTLHLLRPLADREQRDDHVPHERGRDRARVRGRHLPHRL